MAKIKKNNGTSYKKDNDGQVVITKRDDAVLQDITGILGARYIDGNRTDEAIRSIMEFIEEGEKSDIKEEIAMNYDSQFMWFLYPAILFLLTYILLPHRVRAIAIILCLVSFNNAQGQNMHRYGSEVRQGNDSYENEEWLEAVSSYDKAAVEQPDEFIPKFNRGTALMKAGDLQGAAQSFMDAAQSTENASDQSDAYYNLGNLLMEAGQYQEAAGAYIESLSRQPKRKDAIYNLNRAIEQLRQQEQQEQDQDEQSNEDSNNPNEEPQEEQPDQDNSKKDQNEQSDGEDNTEESNPESQQDDQGNEGEQPEPSEGGEEKVKMTPEEIKGLLEAIQRAEEKTAEKMNAKKVKGKKKSGEKDW
ncbi:MAG: tetratricopeptide repeat protein [Chitinophagia bacterium]|nr:tetratricopeptide repeat protein [Chitinophagia bacterium]